MNFLKNIWTKRTLAKTIAGVTLGGAAAYGVQQYCTKKQQLGDIKKSYAQKIIVQPIQQIIIQTAKPSKNDEKQIQQQFVRDKIESEEVLSKDMNEQKTEQLTKINDQQQKSSKIQSKFFNKVSQLQEWKFGQKLKQGQLILILADLPFTKQFEAKMISTINKISTNFKSIKIYKKDIFQKQSRQFLKKQYRANIKQQTLFLLKNSNDKILNNIDFDMYMQYPEILQIYLKQVKTYDSKNIQQLKNKLANMTPNQSCIMYLFDNDQQEEKYKERLMTAKYIQMEMAVNNLSGVKLEAVERKAVVTSGLISEDNNRTNSIHLFKKHNAYTPNQPNFYLQNQKDEIALPFHRMTDIALFSKGKQGLMIPAYLSSLQIFDSGQANTQYICSLKVDRNRIPEQQYSRILHIFSQLKRNAAFPEISYTLNLTQIPYCGSARPQNKEWQIMVTNMDQIEKQTMMHQIKNRQQLKFLDFDESTYLKGSQQYIYENTEIDFNLLKQFLENTVKGKTQKYFKSQKSTPLSSLRKLVASNFKQAIINNDKDHIIFQHSQFCPTCKEISPMIGGFSTIIQEKGLGLQNLQFHQINANKNNVKQILRSPYIPNIYYYKQGWKQQGPVRFPIQLLSYQGVAGLYSFCSITNQVKSISWQLIDEAINTQSKYGADLII